MNKQLQVIRLRFRWVDGFFEIDVLPCHVNTLYVFTTST